jgi:branched-chain amino acid transport system permease protein
MKNIHMNGRIFIGLMAAWSAAVFLFAIAVESSFLLTLAGYTSAFAIFALSVNVMLGGVGEVPLGQCLFFGMGTYGVGIAMNKLGLSFEMGLLIAMICAALFALVIGALTLRLTGAYFSIVSWGIASVAVVVVLNLEHFTGGGMGLFGFSKFTFLGIDLGQPKQYFVTCAAVLMITIIFLNALRSSRFGAAMDSVRQNPHLASSLGVNVFEQRLKAFVLSAVLASVAGGLSVPYLQIVTHESLSVVMTVDALLAVLLGGTQLLFGPVIGAIIFSLVPHYLQMDANVRILVFSCAIILIMMFAPGGLHQLVVAALSKIGHVRFSRKQRSKV